MKGMAMKSYVYPTTSRLINVVQVNDEILQVPFSEIETIYAHIQIQETVDNQNDVYTWP